MGSCKKIGIMLVLLVSILGIVFAVVPTTEPCWVKGTVTGSGVTVEDLNVSAYEGATLLKTAIITDGNYSLNSVGANNGDTITLKVLGATFDTFTFAGFCMTGSDPWVVRDFNVTKQANGTTCTSNTICTSGYCNGTCQTASNPSSGSSGHTSGGTGTITDLSSITTISNTTEPLTYTPSELQTVLEGMTDGQGNPLYSSSEIAYMVANSGDYEFSRNVLVEKIVSSTGETTYRITVTTTVKNKTSGDLKDVKVVIVVPKTVASTASTVTSLLPFTTIVNDPVLEFSIASLGAGQTASIAYSVISTTNPDLNAIIFADPIIRTATKVVPVVTPDTNVTATTDGNKIGGDAIPIVPDYTMPIVVIIIIILIIVVVAVVVGKGKKTKLGK